MNIQYSKELVDFGVDLSFRDLSPDVVHQTKRVILDYFGNALAAYGQKSGQIIVDYAKGVSGKGEATVLGYGEKVSCANAALANGTIAETMEIQDLSPERAPAAHPATSVLPAAIAVAESFGASGEELITASVFGIDVSCRIAAATGTPFRKWGFRPLTIFGTLGASMAAGKLLKLDKESMLNTLGIAGSIEPVGLMQHFDNGNFTMDKDMMPGWASYCGVIAALLAQKGFTGAKDFLEGERYGFFRAYTSWGGKPDLTQMTKGLGKEFHIMNLSFKWHPGSGGSIETYPLLEILKEHKIKAEDVEKITVKTTTLGSTHKRGVNNFRASLFDFPYRVAVTLIDGTKSVSHLLKQHNEERIKDPKVLELREKVEMVAVPEYDTLVSPPVIVTIKMKDGSEYSKRQITSEIKGHPGNPLTDEELQWKFKTLAPIAGLDEKRVKKVIETVEQLEKLENMTKLAKLLSSTQ